MTNFQVQTLVHAAHADLQMFNRVHSHAGEGLRIGIAVVKLMHVPATTTFYFNFNFKI
jgi:hypothetical protein